MQMKATGSLAGSLFIKFAKSTTAKRCFVYVCVLIAVLSLTLGISMGEVLNATPGEFDFGAIAEGEPAVAVTSVENIGNTPVEITNVRTN